MSTLAEIEAAIKHLTPEELRRLENTVRHAAAARQSAPGAVRPGLHAGIWTVADDFDAPLPDAFWLGRDA